MTLAHDLGRGNRAAHRSAVKLQEIGPRIEMQLVKVEEGLCSGKVMFHEFGKYAAVRFGRSAVYFGRPAVRFGPSSLFR